MIKENIQRVRQSILETCSQAQLDPDKIRIVCVTKGRSIQEISEALSSGLSQLGENRLQEALQKYKLLPQAQWQMVGHLQSNKVKDALKIFSLIHSVDSLELAREIDKQALKINKVQDVLLEVKTSPEASKFGIMPEELEGVCAEVLKLKNLEVKGLMTIAPWVDHPDKARPYFSKLRQLRDRLNPAWLLSMGMSDDFEAAIQEGTDMISLGRKIFEG
jgi:PLP dependent protein